MQASGLYREMLPAGYKPAVRVKIMNVTEALEFMEAASWKGSVLGLERMRILMEHLGNPQDSLKYIHVAGTNGKGSTSAMLSSILTAAGYKTGLYTSPHLIQYNERFKINNVDMTDEEMCETAEAVKAASDLMKDQFIPTVFERITAMAFYWFAKEKCDFVILEVGMGGRLDATNIIKTPELCVICNLDLEHTVELGDTIEKIAFEKAGIIKPGAPVLLYAQTEAAEGVIKDICQERGCSLTITDPSLAKVVSRSPGGQVFHYRNRRHITLGLIGTYQFMNALTVADAVDVLQKKYDISEEAVYAGFQNVSWPGRFQVLKKDPFILLDGAHNPNGVRELARCLADYFPETKFTFVFGVMADKDHEDMLRAIAPFASGFIAVTPRSERALASSSLKREIEELTGLAAYDASSVEEGLDKALELHSEGENICIFGSLYQAGDVLVYFRENAADQG